MDPTQIRFRAGEFQAFIATRSFALGGVGKIEKGTEIFYDGMTAEIGGSRYSLPEFRGAIKADWVTFADEYDPEDMSSEIPVSANIQVRAAVGGNSMSPPSRQAISTTETDEREVGSASRHAAAVREANRGGRQARQIGTSVDMQEGVPVRTLKTAAKSKSTLTPDSVGSHLREAGNVEIDAGRGMTEDEMLERMDEASREKYLMEKAMIKSQYVRTDEVAAPREVRRIGPSKEAAIREGITAKVTTGGGTETFDPTGATGDKAVTSVVMEEGMKFTQTGVKRGAEPKPRAVAEKKAEVTLPAEVRLKLAKAVCPDFPDNYDFALPSKKKMARITADFEDRHDVLRAIFAAESDEMKAFLVAEFPAAFTA